MIWGVVGVVVAALGLHGLLRFGSDRRIRSLVASRSSVNVAQLVDELSVGQDLEKGDLETVWTDCALRLKVPADRVRATDRLYGDLTADNLFDPRCQHVEALEDSLNRRTGGTGLSADLRKTATFGDLVLLVARMTAPQRRDP